MAEQVLSYSNLPALNGAYAYPSLLDVVLILNQAFPAHEIKQE